MKSNDYPELKYIQGAFITPDMLVQLVNYVKTKEYDFSNKFLINRIVFKLLLMRESLA